MAEFVSNCPRCEANKITFIILSSIKRGYLNYEWQHTYEAFCVCGNCRRPTIFILTDKDTDCSKLINAKGLTNIEGSANRYVNYEGYISLKDEMKKPPPEYVPDDIKSIFEEASKCLAANCFNAAGAMFRLCLDMATAGLLPPDDVPGLNKTIRRSLGLRLNWIFATGRLPEALRELSKCIKDDGNDGAHTGLLGKEDADDLFDFTFVLLERMYTEPTRIRLAEERRAARRA